jgi:anti-anti-sigma factor
MSEAVNSAAAAVSGDEDDVLLVSTYEHDGGVPVVLAQGDVDLQTAPTLRKALETACDKRTGQGTVAVDIRQVPFIDSAGLALLVEIRKRFYDNCRLALIIERGSQPERVLKLGRFDTFLKVVYTPDDLSASAAPAAAS